MFIINAKGAERMMIKDIEGMWFFT